MTDGWLTALEQLNNAIFVADTSDVLLGMEQALHWKRRCGKFFRGRAESRTSAARNFSGWE